MTKTEPILTDTTGRALVDAILQIGAPTQGQIENYFDDHPELVNNLTNEAKTAATSAAASATKAENSAQDIEDYYNQTIEAASQAVTDIATAKSEAIASLSPIAAETKNYRDQAAAIVTPDGLAAKVNANSDALSQFRSLFDSLGLIVKNGQLCVRYTAA